jgi:hypothetical protein
VAAAVAGGAVLCLVGFEIAMLMLHPIGQGSSSWSPQAVGPCDDLGPSPDDLCSTFA